MYKTHQLGVNDDADDADDADDTGAADADADGDADADDGDADDDDNDQIQLGHLKLQNLILTFAKLFFPWTTEINFTIVHLALEFQMTTDCAIGPFAQCAI